jgi:hypothetical protein
MRRTLRGLYFLETGGRLPPSIVPTIYCVEGFEGADLRIKGKVRGLAEAALAGRSKTHGNNVFRYWVRDVEDHPAILWLFSVYERVWFLSVVQDPKKKKGSK